MGAEALIERILSEAKREAEQTLKRAEAHAAEALAAAKQEELRMREERAKERIRLERENEARFEALSESEYRFAILKVRQEAADAAFTRAAEKLSALPKSRAEKFWGSLLERYGEEGDEVVFSEREEVLKPEFVSSVSARCGKTFRASGTKGRFLGGMILRGAYCDKNLTAEMLVREYRERSESEVFSLLFGEERK